MNKKLLLLILLVLASLSAGYSPCIEDDSNYPECKEDIQKEFTEDPVAAIDNYGTDTISNLISNEDLANAARDNGDVLTAFADKPALQTSLANFLLSNRGILRETQDDNGVEVAKKGGPEVVEAVAKDSLGEGASVEAGATIDVIGDDGEIITGGPQSTMIEDVASFSDNNFPVKLNEEGSIDLGEGGTRVLGGTIKEISCEGGVNCVVKVAEGAKVILGDPSQLDFEIEFVKESGSVLYAGQTKVEAGPGGMIVIPKDDGSLTLEGLGTKISDRFKEETIIPESITACYGGCDLILTALGNIGRIDVLKGGTDSKGKPYDSYIEVIDPETGDNVFNADASRTTTYFPPGSSGLFGPKSASMNWVSYSKELDEVAGNVIGGNKIHLGFFEKPVNNYMLAVDKQSAAAIGILNENGEKTNVGFVIQDGQTYGSNFLEAFKNTNIQANIEQDNGIFTTFTYDPVNGLDESSMTTESVWEQSVSCSKTGNYDCKVGSAFYKAIDCPYDSKQTCYLAKDDDLVDAVGNIREDTGELGIRTGCTPSDDDDCSRSANELFFDGGDKATYTDVEVGFAEMNLIETQWEQSVTCSKTGNYDCKVGSSLYKAINCPYDGGQTCYLAKDGDLIDEFGNIRLEDGSDSTRSGCSPSETDDCTKSSNANSFNGGARANYIGGEGRWKFAFTEEGKYITLNGYQYKAEACPESVGGMCYRYDDDELYTSDGRLIDKEGKWVSKDGSECSEDNPKCFSGNKEFFEGGTKATMTDDGIKIFDDTAFNYDGSSFRVFDGNFYEQTVELAMEGAAFEGRIGTTANARGLRVNTDVYNIETLAYSIPEDNIENVMEIVSKFPPGVSAMALQALSTGIESGRYEEGMPVVVHDIATQTMFAVVDGELIKSDAGHTYRNVVSNVDQSRGQPLGTSFLKADIGIGFNRGLVMDGLDEYKGRLGDTSIERAANIDPRDYGNSNNWGREIVFHLSDQDAGSKGYKGSVKTVGGRLVLRDDYDPNKDKEQFTAGCSQSQDPIFHIATVNSALDNGGGLIYVGASKGAI